MIGRLSGRLLRKTPGEVVLDVAGVGYRVTIPLSTFYQLGAEGDELALEVHTHVREDTLALFGFHTARERVLFERLLGVSGVGPRLACAILSGLPPDELLAALGAADAARLTAIPGVGRKTAERLGLELRDKVSDLLADGDGAAPAPPAAESEADLDAAVSALVNLGYNERQARRAVGEITAAGGDGRPPLEELLRDALRRLSR